MRNWKASEFTRRIGIDLPIVLGAFGGASSTELVAAVSNAGGLGSYGAYGLSGDRILEVARDIRSRTDRPFALNIWMPHAGSEEFSVSDAEFRAALEPLLPYFERLGVEPPQRPARFYPSHREQVDAVLEARPAVFSFVYGAPDAAVMEKARSLGVTTMGVATTVEEAVFLEEAGVDVVVASGLEAGGHRVSFLRAPEQSLIGNISLVPRVVDAVNLPVVAAGGIADGRGVAAALMLGAQAAQLGTAFLATDQSGASELHRDRLFGPDARDTVLTRAFSGRLARGIRNELSLAGEDGRLAIASFPLQGWLLGKLKSAAIEQGEYGLMSLWAGQSAPLIRHRDASALIEALIAETDTLLA